MGAGPDLPGYVTASGERAQLVVLPAAQEPADVDPVPAERSRHTLRGADQQLDVEVGVVDHEDRTSWPGRRSRPWHRQRRRAATVRVDCRDSSRDFETRVDHQVGGVDAAGLQTSTAGVAHRK